MRRTRGTTPAVALLLLTLGVMARDSGTATDPGPIETTEVAVDDNFFSPQTAVVGGGETVTWSWRGGEPHNVTWDTVDLPDSNTQTAGSHEVTAPESPGEYGYHCSIHGAPGQGMHGTVIVE